MIGEQVYLMTSAELSMIAAASGLKRFLMFEEDETPDREHQLQAVFRLARDGFFVCGESTIQPGEVLRLILPLIKHPAAVVAMRSASDQTPPACLYWHDEQETLQVTPHGCRRGFYELSLRKADPLLEDLEARGLLPAQPDDRLAEADNEDEYVDRKLADLSKFRDEGNIREVFGADLLSICDRYDPLGCAVTDCLLIVQGTFTPHMVLVSALGLRTVAYSRDGFVKWLKGAIS